MNEFAPIPRLPFPMDAFRIEQYPDKVILTLPDEAVVRMAPNDIRSIGAFFDAAPHYASLYGFEWISRGRDELRSSTVFTFYR